MSELVSVLISLYRPNETYLREQLLSIAHQTYDNVELVVYNDDPSDCDRSKWVRKLMGPSATVRYYHGDKNLGYAKAFERLVSLARGAYIALCDQDDVWLPSRLERGVEELERGYALAVCDRAIIDGQGHVVEESYRHAHPNEPECSWNSGDDITVRAAFSCYAIGMATMLRANVAKALVPFPKGTAHDFWLALGASELGQMAFIDEPLVQYRRHGNNASSLFSGIKSKEDWYERRVRPKYGLAQRFRELFPGSQHCEQIMAFAQARLDRSVRGLFRCRHINARIAWFEIALRLAPERLVRLGVRVLRNRAG